MAPACTAPAAAVANRANEPAGDGGAVFDTAWSIIQRTHWDSTYNGVNWTALRTDLRPRAVAARTRGELRTVLAEMVARLRQSHFAIIPQELSEATASGGATRSGGTAGFELRLTDGRALVTMVDTGGPAWQAGVRPGWVLESTSGCPVATRLARLPKHQDARLTSLDAYRVLAQATSGSEGDRLPLTFRDGSDAPRAVSLVLGTPPGTITKFGNLPPMPAHLAWQRVQRDGRTIGIIRFSIWMPVLAAQFDAAVDSLRGSDAIVLDLRGNFGGVGGMANGVAGHFLDTAWTIGTMHQRTATVKFNANPRRVDTRNRPVRPFAGPLAIVIDELSVSTTEIFAAGLQAIGRATVFGVQSAGQALPATPEKLPNGDILYHAIADFVSPNGKPVEGDGVIPNHVTRRDRRAYLNGTDAALSAALEWAARQVPRS